MNRELFDFASHMYKEVYKIDEALSNIGYYNDYNSLADKTYEAIWNSLEVDPLLHLEKEEIEIEPGTYYPCQKWVLDDGKNKIYDDDFSEMLDQALKSDNQGELDKVWDFCVKAHANNK